MSSLTLQDLDNLQGNPSSRSCITEYKARVFGVYERYDEFVNRINKEVDSIILKMESARDHYKELPETTLVYIICMMLQQKCIQASHGNYQSGETDLIVEHGPNLWIAEAKWWEQDENAFEGMRQLATRYSTGGDTSSSGSVLLFNRTNNVSAKLQRLIKLYENKHNEFSDIKVECCTYSSFAFKTKHTHGSSGLTYEVRHRALNFHHSPQDKSARTRVKNSPDN